jgi:DNA-binding beta-propeller fold protein YncE
LTSLRRSALALATGALVTLALAAPADCFVYWAEDAGGDTKTISRANLSGTGVDRSFITVGATPDGVAVNASHIYWVNNFTGAIGRASLDGSHVRRSFITTGSPGGFGVAVDGTHIYWAQNATGTIWRANLDGTGVDQSFITLPPGSIPIGVAVDGSHVYWTNQSANTIGRANLDGTGVRRRFITGAIGPTGVAVDGAHIYWANNGIFPDSTIGRANLDGTGIDQSFVAADNPLGVAVDRAHIFWACGCGSIGRSNLGGSGVDQNFIFGTNFLTGVAVDDAPALRVPDAGVVEGAAAEQGAIVEVRLSHAHDMRVTVDYATEDGTAKAPGDYASASGTLTFRPGDTEEAIEVPIEDDLQHEPLEALRVRLSNARFAAITDPVGVVTITDNDP